MRMFSHPSQPQPSRAAGKAPQLRFSNPVAAQSPVDRLSHKGGGFSHVMEVPEGQEGVIIRRPRIH